MTRFADPLLLLLLLLVPLYVFVEVRFRRARIPALLFPAAAEARRASSRTFAWKRFLRPASRAAALALVVVALARPQAGAGQESVMTEGIDIALAVDVSASMKAEDFKPRNRLAVAKEVVADFIEGRRSDRIGMVVFASRAFMQCPLTLDYNILLELLDSVEIGMIDERSTAIGTAIATATNRLRESDAESKVVILLTDGRSNAGEIDPVTAAKAAEAVGVKVYTIGAGSPEGGRIPIDDPVLGRRYANVKTDIDEETLREIASITGGRYYRAKTEGMLADVYRKIGELETTKIEVKHFTTYTELAPRFIIAALVVLVLETLVSAVFVRGLP
ncbi:MAG: VWA domain-containing protein [Candidatus Eisenbacteria bacterium]|nr:VWA domain-containing protein [Candidatus Eisenbacteria bacterium]